MIQNTITFIVVSIVNDLYHFSIQLHVYKIELSAKMLVSDIVSMMINITFP